MEVSYTELNPKTGKTGTVAFTDINARLYNITNDSTSIRSNPVLRMTASGRFMKEAPVKANFAIDLKNQKNGNFEVEASLGKISAAALNRLTIPLGSVRIDEINFRALEAKIKGDNNQASGTVKLEYDDLKITVLRDGDTVSKRKLLSFIANSFVLKSQNPSPGQAPRVAQASFPRNKQKSFFNLVWKTVFTGAKTTVGYK